MKKTSIKEKPPRPRLILFNKPFRVLCQFTDDEGRPTLSNYIPVKDVYAAGRLDYDSEGLVILTSDGSLQHKISDPRHKFPKTYLVQVEGMPDEDSLGKLRKGILIKDGMTKPAKVDVIEEPRDIWPRVPPIRYRKNIPATWLRLTISEGRNRQVRRMTSFIGHPCLRLIRVKIGQWKLGGLKPGEWKEGKAPKGLGGWE